MESGVRWSLGHDGFKLFKSFNRCAQFQPFERLERLDRSRPLFPLRRKRANEVTTGKVSNGFAGFRERSGHLGARINPQDREVRCPDIDKSMRLIRRDKRGIKRMQTMSLSVNLRFGLSFENGYLLITVVRVQRNFRAGREAGQARRDVLRADLFSDEGNGLYAIAAVDHRQRIDFQNVRLCHSDYLLSEELRLRDGI